MQKNIHAWAIVAVAALAGCVPTGAVPSIGQQTAAAKAAGFTVETTATGDQSQAADCANVALIRKQMAAAGMNPDELDSSNSPQGC